MLLFREMRKPSLILIAAIILGSLIFTATIQIAEAGTFPAVIPLPDGFRPEGIAVGRGTDFFAGSLADGSVFGGDLRIGDGEIVVPPQSGRIAVGLAVDDRTNYLFVAGGPSGQGYVYDLETGQTAGTFNLTAPGTFVNDVVVTRDAAYFTDSFRPYFYRVPLGKGGRLPASNAGEEIALSGDWVQLPGFNANGIDATPNGKTLLLVNSSAGELYRVNPSSGEAARIDLGSGSVMSGDGILLSGMTLYVVQNFLNQIAVINLEPDLASGEIVATITDSNFRIPTTIAEFGDALYVVNARFDVQPPTPETEYEAVRVSKH